MEAYGGGSNAPDKPDKPDGPEGTDTADGAAGAGASVPPAGPGSLPRPRSSGGAERPADPAALPPAGTGPAASSGPADPSGPAAPSAPGTAPAPGTPAPGAAEGIAALSPLYQAGAALALAVVAVAVCVHLGMVFLHVAPSNTVSKEHGKAVDEWIYPEFEQNWKLFAPNPLQQNIGVQVRAETGSAGGDLRTTGWYDLSAQDGRAIEGNLLPSHTQQNELRRALDFYADTHDGDSRATGPRGALSEQYLRRIVVLRLDRAHAAGAGGRLERVQVRVRTINVPPPAWSGEKVSTTPAYRLLPWWAVPAGEAQGGVA
ncbi:DUF5819 family protein [Streptomyces sp. NPDC047017]|uniref:DUF5819 family protein n=1 Tax=Streptomyces sp. NPDC047017 TaxID=3155024 RepID=UPI00340B178F